MKSFSDACNGLICSKFNTKTYTVHLSCILDFKVESYHYLPINPIDLPRTKSPFNAPIDIYSSASSLLKKKVKIHNIFLLSSFVIKFSVKMLPSSPPHNLFTLFSFVACVHFLHSENPNAREVKI